MRFIVETYLMMPENLRPLFQDIRDDLAWLKSLVINVQKKWASEGG